MALTQCIVLVGEVVAGTLKDRVTAIVGEAIALPDKTAAALVAKGIVKLATAAQAKAAAPAPKAAADVKVDGEKTAVTEVSPAEATPPPAPPAPAPAPAT